MNPLGLTPLFHRLLTTAACGALIAVPQAARATRQKNSFDENKSLQEWSTLDWPAVLDPGGPLAPYNARASKAAAISVQPDFILFRTGAVDLDATLRNGHTRGSIDISVRGYAPGTYAVDAVTVSSGSTVALGSLTVASGTIPIWTGTIPVVAYATPLLARRPAASKPEIVAFWPFGGYGSAQFGGRHSPFPKGFNPFDVQSVSLSDSNGNLVSTATLTPVPDGYYSALSPLTSGAAAPNARGSALIRANTPPLFLPMTELADAVKPLSTPAAAAKLNVWSGPVPISPIVIQPGGPILVWTPPTGELVIHAQKLPASTAVTYWADGTELGTASTDSSGNLKISAAQGGTGTIPSTVDLFSVQTVTVQDSSGDVLVSAGF